MSNALTEIVDYIDNKINKAGKGRPSDGVSYLKDNFEVHEITRLVDISFQIIQMHFTKATSETPAGECRLTTVSSAIGNRICTHDENDGIFTRWEKEIRVGDLLIEAYFNTGFVDLYYPKMRDGFHIVSATSKWTDLWEIGTETIVNNLKGTVMYKPEPITGIIQMHFTKSTSETPAGECRLTTVSSAIGNRICTHDENDGIFTKWDREVRLGDLFIEAYFNTGYVDLYYPQMRDGFHIVSATSKWTDLWEIDTETIVNNLKGTVMYKPEPITGMMQMHRYEEEPVIKGRTKDDLLDTDAVYVKAINKLQRTGWKINTTILDAMLKDYKNFISFDKIEDLSLIHI